VYLGRRPYWEAFREFMGDLGLTDGAIDEAERFARQQAAVAEKRVLFDGVAETLAQLKARGLKLAVLSDTESREAAVRRRLADLGIERWFDVVATSIDMGHVKPQPEAFATVLRRLDVSPHEAAFVGHDVDELEGAARSGLTAIAYNAESGVPAAIHIAAFAELLDLRTK
jgi:putative hydrolase of the HAD superfamily